MKRNNDNLSSGKFVTQLDKNFSRLLKLSGESNKPGRKFTAELINGALNELKQPEVETAEVKNATIRTNWLEKY